MNHARKILDIQSPPDQIESRRPLASWYTPGFSDGLGDRLLMFDNSPESSLELLRFNRRFGDRPTFENALRQRVEQLEQFTHPSIAKVRAVEWLGPGEGLALVSNHTAGRRLSEVLHDARGAAFALELVRQLTPALASLQQQGEGIAHGALSAERIIVTPEGRLVIVEHVLGSALESLEMPASRLRSDLGIAVGGETVSLDARGDVVQLGLVALSLLLGRRIDPADYPDRGGNLLAEFAWGHRGSSGSTALLGWLERALQISGRSFESAQEAHEALREFSDDRDALPSELRRPLHAFTMAISAGQTVGLPALIVHEPADEEPVVAERTSRLEPTARISTDNLIDYPRAQLPAVAAVPAVPAAADDVVSDVDTPTTPWQLVNTPDRAPVEMLDTTPTVHAMPRPAEPGPAEPSRGSDRTRWIIGGLTVLAATEALFIAGLLYGRWKQPAATPPVATNAANVATPTPVATPIPPPVEPVASPTPATLPPADASGPKPPSADPGRPAGSGIQMATRMEVTSDPPGARVTVDGTPRGTTPLGLVVKPGQHSVIVTDGNSTTTRNVNVAEGATTSVMAAFAPAGASAGWVAITSPIELQVKEGGNLLGTTGIARLMLPAGRHDLELSNTALGFQTAVAVDIQPGKIATTTVAIPNGSLSINALPWATVLLDGKSIGTTPIANLDVPLGTHEVIWRHPQFGERKQTIVITAKAPVRLMMDLNK